MHQTIAELVGAGPVITDGAWGTQLQARGLAVGDCPEAWNLDHAEAVEAVARDYAEAGSRIILTNTFGGCRLALATYGLGDRARDLNRAGAEISRRGAGEETLVFGSIGPSGKLLMMGDVSINAMAEAYAEQAAALAEGGVHGLVVETMADLEEAQVAVRSAKDTGLPVVACMVFDAGDDRCHTMMGVTPEQAAEGLDAVGADVIGANCGQGIEAYAEIGRRLHAATASPIWLKPNAGTPEIVAGLTEYKTTPEEFAARAPALLEAGATFIGGCCGTAPEFIRVLGSALVPHAEDG